MKLYLLGEQTKIEIEIFGQAFPSSKDAMDLNMLDSDIKVNIPGHHVAFSTMLSRVDLSKFFTSIKIMYEKMTGISILNNLDDTILLKGEINALGHIAWYAETCYPAGTGATLSFEFISDQSYLERLIKELRAITNMYPVIKG